MDKTSHVTHQEQDNSLYTLYYNYNKPNKGNYLIYQYKKIVKYQLPGIILNDEKIDKIIRQPKYCCN